MNRKKKNPDLMEWISIISKFLENHFKKIFVVFLLIVTGAGSFLYVKNMKSQREYKSFDELSKIIVNYREKKENFKKALESRDEKSDEKSNGNGKTKEKKNLSLPTDDLNQDYGDEVTKLENFIKKNPGHSASVEAALTLTEIYSEYKLKEKAIKVLDGILKFWPEKNLLYYIMEMRLGNLWATMTDGCEKALSHWQLVGESKSFVAAQAQLQMGLCFQKTGKFQEARTWFERVQKDFPESSKTFNVKRYLRFLEFQSQREKEKKGNVKEEKENQQKQE